jgi:hypothetical protein
VPTVVPPDVQLVGADACGPKTVKVIVPVGAAPLASVAVIDEVEIATLVVPVAGAVIAMVGCVLTTVEAIDAPQALAALLLVASPAKETYHQ